MADEKVTRLILVRHGQSEGNRDRVFTGHGPSPLTALGQRQAEAAAHAIAVAPVDAIYSSDLPRALSTAAPLAARTGLAITHAKALRERDVGAWTGLSFEQVIATDPIGWQALLSRDAGYRPPGGESHRDCSARVGAFLDELLARHPSGRVVLYSHGEAIHHLLRYILGMDRDDAPRAYLRVDNASLHRVDHRAEGGFLVQSLNEVGHLTTLLG